MVELPYRTSRAPLDMGWSQERLFNERDFVGVGKRHPQVAARIAHDVSDRRIGSRHRKYSKYFDGRVETDQVVRAGRAFLIPDFSRGIEIGRASCRERVYKSV